MNANEDKAASVGRGFGALSQRVIGCAITVGNSLGAGLLASVYENALCVELEAQGIVHERQKALVVCDRDVEVGQLCADLIVEGRLPVELKALKQLTAEHEAQAMSYMHATGLQVGLLPNFDSPRLGLRRIVLDYKRTMRRFRSEPPGISKPFFFIRVLRGPIS